MILILISQIMKPAGQKTCPKLTQITKLVSGKAKGRAQFGLIPELAFWSRSGASYRFSILDTQSKQYY